MEGNTKLWILVATCLWSTVLMVCTEAGDIDLSGIDQTGRDMIIRSVVPKNDVSGAEFTQHIVGINNLCVDVYLGFYFDGNVIQLYPCKSNGDANQQWTREHLGTIQSNGKCLAINGTSPGSFAIISDCDKVETGAKVWKVQEDGTILNPFSSLVLTSKSGKSGSLLTVETNAYALGQGWQFTNDSTPLTRSIVGRMDYCLQADNEIQKAAKCVENKTEQKWNFHVDGSIRPVDGNEDLCLTSNGISQGSFVVLVYCSPASSSQRWMLGDDNGTDYLPILNLNKGLVLGVDFNLQIVVSTYHGGATQIWHLSS